MRVVLVRPWTDARSGGGCCGAEVRDGVCFDGRVDSGAPTDVHAHARRNADTDADVRLVAETYLRLQQELPGVDVQIVGVDNTAYLLPTVFRALRARYGVVVAVRGLNRATTAGAVLVDGEFVGHLTTLGVDSAIAEIRVRCLVR
ncbi:MAG: hypothetical protein K0Q93_2194 [Nocardioidaceae bacterium]|nr:hypothetical protein [Nocardioidaceae bacterium]